MTLLLSDLKGAQLSIIVALWFGHVHGRPSLSNKDLAFETGYHDSKTMAEALQRLSQRGLVVCLGNPANRNEWTLTGASRQLFLPAGTPELESRENPDSLPAGLLPALPAGGETRENPNSLHSEQASGMPSGGESRGNPDSLPGLMPDFEREMRESGKSQLSAPESESVNLNTDSGKTESGADALFGPAWLTRVTTYQTGELEQRYLKALRAGKVYRQLCASLAR